MLRAHKIRLYPNNLQSTYLTKACGVARFAYNWALAEWKRLYWLGKKVNEGILRKQLNSIKRKQFPWMLEVTKCAVQLAIKNDLASAFKNFFSKKANFPKFHKKGVKESFSLSNDQFKIHKKFVKIPNLGLVRLSEELRFEGKILGATISKKSNKWFISVTIETSSEEPPIRENQAVGVDLGIEVLATLSDGKSIIGPKANSKYGKKLRRLNQCLSRRIGAKKYEKKSNNFKKIKLCISKLYYKMTNLRTNETHKLTTMIVRKYTLIGIENLNVKGMMSNHKLARCISDMSFFEFKRQLEYKAKTLGSKIVVADKWFPSSKICSNCGNKLKELPLGVRNWICKHCNTFHYRDVNAAINLKNYALRSS